MDSMRRGVGVGGKEPRLRIGAQLAEGRLQGGQLDPSAAAHRARQALLESRELV